MEIWKSILGYEGRYEASSKGQIKSLLRNKIIILKPIKDKQGYLYVTLHKDNDFPRKVSIHKIVCDTFKKEKPKGLNIVIDHKDNKPSNNNLSNLQYITNRENCSKDRKGGTSKFTGVYFSPRINKWIAEIEINGKGVRLCSTECEGYANIKYKEALKKLDNK